MSDNKELEQNIEAALRADREIVAATSGRIYSTPAPAPMTPERLAEIRELLEEYQRLSAEPFSTHGPYWTVAEKLKGGGPALVAELLAEVERLRAENEDVALCEESHPGFTVTCRACGSPKVAVENTLGFSEISGVWGSIDLKCVDCRAETPIFEP